MLLPVLSFSLGLLLTLYSMNVPIRLKKVYSGIVRSINRDLNEITVEYFIKDQNIQEKLNSEHTLLAMLKIEPYVGMEVSVSLNASGKIEFLFFDIERKKKINVSCLLLGLFMIGYGITKIISYMF